MCGLGQFVLVCGGLQGPRVAEWLICFFVFLFYRREMKARRAWQVKVRQISCSFIFPLVVILLCFSFIFITSLFQIHTLLLLCFQSLTSSSKSEPKLQRWHPAYRRHPVATQVHRREPPAARSQTDRKTLCSPCKPFTFDLWSSSLRPNQLSSITWGQTDPTLKHIHLNLDSSQHSSVTLQRFAHAMLVKRESFLLSINFSLESEGLFCYAAWRWISHTWRPASDIMRQPVYYTFYFMCEEPPAVDCRASCCS